MGKKVYLTGLILIVIVAVIFSVRFILGGPEDSWICQDGIWIKHGNPSESMPETPCLGEITYNNATADLIVVELPYPGAVTGKDFSVIGKARGYWFFEASFPVEVLDKDGQSLAIGIAQAGPDPETGEINWMTENFVPFKSDLKIPESYIGPATLILKKDNPSGLPEKDASISFPIIIEY